MCLYSPHQVLVSGIITLAALAILKWPVTYEFTNTLTGGKTFLKKAPTTTGILLHALVFFIFLMLIIRSMNKIPSDQCQSEPNKTVLLA